MRRGTEGSNGRPDADDVAGNLGCAAGGVLNVAGDLARLRALLLHRRRIDLLGHGGRRTAAAFVVALPMALVIIWIWS